MKLTVEMIEIPIECLMHKGQDYRRYPGAPFESNGV
jgi:hypothetical protein